ncbi:MAG: hypothetical protein AAFU64_09155 [Bacteroidota bacterium]
MAVEKIEILDADGQLAMIISNGERIDEGNHRRYGPKRTDPGLLFFNNRGEECGGFIYNSEENDSSYNSFQHLSFDQYRGDQNLILAQYQQADYHFKGLMLSDYPDDSVGVDYERTIDSVLRVDPQANFEKARRTALRKLISEDRLEKRRLILGSEDGVPSLQMMDQQGQTRIKIYVDSLGQPHLEFYDQGDSLLAAWPDVKQ